MNTQYDFTGARLNDTAAKGVAARWSRELTTGLRSRLDDQAALVASGVETRSSRKAWIKTNKDLLRRLYKDGILWEHQLSRYVWEITLLHPDPMMGALWVVTITLDAKHFTNKLVPTKHRITVHALQRSIERGGPIYRLRTPQEVTRLTLLTLADCLPELPPCRFSVMFKHYGLVAGEIEDANAILIKTVIPINALEGSKLARWEALDADQTHVEVGLVEH